jgi:GGDEF domain-containing protein
MPGAIGIVGLTPALAESLRPLLRAAGFALGDYLAEHDQVACVAGDFVADGVVPGALVILEGATPSPLQSADHLPRVAVARPFTPERLLVAVAMARSEAEARQVASEQFARVTLLYQRATAICDDLDRELHEVAVALVVLLHDQGGYADVRVTFGDASRLYEVPRSARMLRVPIVSGGESVGHICATVGEDAAEWSALGDHRRLLETVAACAGAYWARRAERERVARLRAEDMRRVEELAAVNEVALATASLDLDQVLAELIPRTHGLLDADYCILVLRDPADDSLTIRAAVGPGADGAVGLVLSAEGTFSRQLIESPACRRWAPEDGALGIADCASGEPGTPLHAAIGAPLLVQGNAIGAIVAANRREEDFTEADLHFLATVAAQAAIAVQNARLYADTLRLARYDALTGLANRRYFLEQLAQAVGMASRYDRPLALLLIDLDHFKAVNDTFGHLAGDTLLRAVADRLRTRLRRSDFPARYAGDELAAILPETTLSGAVARGRRGDAAADRGGDARLADPECGRGGLYAGLHRDRFPAGRR